MSTNGTVVNVQTAELKGQSIPERVGAAFTLWFGWTALTIWIAAWALMVLIPLIAPIFGATYLPGYWTCWSIAAIASLLRFALPPVSLYK